MKFRQLVVFAAALGMGTALLGAEPKKLLLVTTTASFRHSSIDVAEQTIQELARQSGDFIVVSTTDSAHYPKYPTPQPSELAGGRGPGPGGRGGVPGGPRIPGLTDDQRKKVNELFAPLAPLSQSVAGARTALAAAVFTSSPNEATIRELCGKLEAAELALAQTRYTAFDHLNRDISTLSAEQIGSLQQDYQRVRRGGFGGPAGARGPSARPNDVQREALAKIDEGLVSTDEAYAKRRIELSQLIHSATAQQPEIERKVKALTETELAAAIARAAAVGQLQLTADKLSDEQLAGLARMYTPGPRGPGGPGGPGGRGGRRGGGPGGFGGDPAQLEQVRLVLEEFLSPSALENYDGVFFLHTTGQLPFPDMPAFLDWVKSGHAVIGSHAASDCFHESDHPGEPHSFIQMLGGEFAGHGAQETVDLYNVDPRHPANASLPETFKAHDEMYLFKNYEQSQVHSLLNMNEHPNERTPGHYPVSWSKNFGQGRVFYTSLGHRHDMWDPNWIGTDGQRINAPEVAENFRKHLLGGIRWSLGLAESP